MGEMIQKPDANPIVLAVLNLFFCGALGYFLVGQKKKAMYFLGAWVIGVCLSVVAIGGLIAMAVSLIGAYDIYLLGQKLQAGESIGENENALGFLNSIIKD